MPEQQVQEGQQTQEQDAGATSLFDQIELPGAPESAGPTEGQEGAEGGGAEKPPQPQDPPRVYAGRFNKVEQLEEAYMASGQEARRLQAEFIQETKERERIQREFEDFKADRDLQGQFQALSPEDEKRLKDEDPGKWMDYRFALKEHSGKMESAKKAREEARRMADEEGKNINAAIRKSVIRMMGDQEKYPGYNQLQVVGDRILDIAPELAGHEWTPVILYYASKGLQAISAERKALQAAKAARGQAGGHADATARQTGGTGTAGGSGAPAGNSGLDSLNAEIVKAHQPNVLPSF